MDFLGKVIKVGSFEYQGDVRLHLEGPPGFILSIYLMINLAGADSGSYRRYDIEIY